MTEGEAHISDGHFGAQYTTIHIRQAVEVLVQQLDFLAQECHARIKVVINGDLIAGPYQRGDANDPRADLYPLNWEELLREQAKPLFDFLRQEQFEVDYLLGNSERRHDMTLAMLESRFGQNVHWGDATGEYALYRPADRKFVTHMNLGEPPLPVLERSAKAELAGYVSDSWRNNSYLNQDRSIDWRQHIALTTMNMSRALYDQAAELDPVAAEIDDVHKKSCLKNARMDNLLAIGPQFLRDWKGGLVSTTLNRVYLRTITSMHVAGIEPASVSFGHIHDAFIYTREQIAQRLGVMPNALLQYVANSGTMIPLTEAHGGSDQSHMLFWRGYEPELYQIFDKTDPKKKPHLLQVGGERVSQAA